MRSHGKVYITYMRIFSHISSLIFPHSSMVEESGRYMDAHLRRRKVVDGNVTMPSQTPAKNGIEWKRREEKYDLMMLFLDIVIFICSAY